jgi:hypothetical protein
MKKNYNGNFFRRFDPDNNFFWKWTPSVGKYDYLELQTIKLDKHMILLNLWDKMKKCRWAFSCVYGPAHEELMVDFLIELASFYHGIDILYIVAGDFNIPRNVLEKNNLIVLPHSSKVFNTMIHSLALREIHMKGVIYT